MRTGFEVSGEPGLCRSCASIVPVPPRAAIATHHASVVHVEAKGLNTHSRPADSPKEGAKTLIFATRPSIFGRPFQAWTEHLWPQTLLLVRLPNSYTSELISSPPRPL